MTSARKAVALLIFVLVTPLTQAQTLPKGKTITLVVPYAPGGNIDITARVVGIGMQKYIGQPMIVLNKPGAEGLIAGNFVAQSVPDGTTLFVSAAGSLVFARHLHDLPAFDWKKDFSPIGSMTATPLLLQTKKNLEANNVKELIALAKKREIFMAIAGAGSNNLLSEELQYANGVKWTLVTYKGNAPAMNALMSGEVDFSLQQISVGLPFSKDGRVRTLAVSSPRRLASLPDVPTLVEQGFPDLVVETLIALLAPSKTPSASTRQLADALTKVLNEPEVISKMEVLGSPVRAMSPEELGDFMQRQEDKWLPVLKRSMKDRPNN